MAVPNSFATATSAIPLANLDANFAYYDTAYSISSTTITFLGAVNIGTGAVTIGNGTFSLNQTTAAINLGTSQTTSVITMGGTAGTGAITIGRSTGAQTVSLANGATTSGTTKTVSIGEAGVSGSITNVNIGSAVAGATGKTTVNSQWTQVNGMAYEPPITVNAATYTAAITAHSIIFKTTACTLTLPAAETYPGLTFTLKNITATAVTSATANVVPLGSATAGTAILAATAGKFVMLQSDGTNWITMMAN